MKRPTLRICWAALCGVALLSVLTPAYAEAPSKIAPALQPLVDFHALAGVVTLVATADQVLDLQAVGYMDVPAQTPMRTDSLFWIASQSKPIAATALMMMVDEGKVSLDDPVTKYLPEFKEQWLLAEHDDKHTLLKKPARPILLRHLLSHTSGMLYKTAVEQPTLDVLPLEQRMHNYVMSPLQFEPGSKHLYANAGINTAARIVELVSGKPYPEFIQVRILNPLHMVDTTFWPTEQQLQRLAKAYEPNAAKSALEEVPIPQLRYPLSDRTRYVQPAGGLFSTAHDLLNFYRMLLGGGVFEGQRILSAEAVHQMSTKQTGNLKQDYGFGLFTTKGKIGHGGTFGTLSGMDPEHGLISIFLVQYGGSPKDLSKFHQTFQAAVQKEFGPAKKPATSSTETHDAVPSVVSVESFESLAPVSEWTEQWPDGHGAEETRRVKAAVWNAAIQAALDQHGVVFLPKRETPYYLNGPVILKSGQRLTVAKDAEIRLKPNSNTCMVRNASIISGQIGPVDSSNAPDKGIIIEGGIWTTVAFEHQSNGNNVGRTSAKNEHPGSYGVIVLSNVADVVVRHLTIRQSRPFGIQMSNCRDFKVTDIHFDNHLRDGVHINGPARDGTISNITGVTHDDFVALNAWDWKGSAITFGPISHILVENIQGSDVVTGQPDRGPAGSQEIRLLAGTKNFGDGQKLNCNIADCTFRHIGGIRTVKMYDQPNLEMGRDKDYAEPIGKMSRLAFQDIELTQPASPGTFQIGSDVDGLSIQDINLKFAPTSAFRLVAIGPLSQTYKHKKDDPGTWVEIFSPDKDCTVRHLEIGKVVAPADSVLPAHDLIQLVHQTINPDYPHSIPRGGVGRGILEN